MSVDLGAFNRWNQDVDLALQAAGRPVTSRQILLDVRLTAFKAGIVPSQFASQPHLPLAATASPSHGALRVFLWSIPLSMIVCFFVAFALCLRPPRPEPTQDATTGPERVSPPPSAPLRQVEYEVTAERLARAYSDNEVAANGQFLGRVIGVTGIVESVTDNPPTIHLSGSELGDQTAFSVRCLFQTSRAGQLARLGPGKTVHVVGVVKGATNGLFPSLAACELR